MCGIVGLYHLKDESVDKQCVLHAAHLLRHRGPDDEGYLLLNTNTGTLSLRNGPDTPHDIQNPSLNAPTDFIPNLVLGHRRLAIIDLSLGGHEPMTVPGQKLWITFNGEIYNYLELRQELQSLGYQFHTDSDVEVLLQAYDAWGIECLQRLIGMFAFALWDQLRQRLWCVRDRLGVKPFYYSATPSRFAFASEIKALRPLVPGVYRPDMQQLFWFLHYGLVYNAPYTFFEGINELPGGHYLLIEHGKVSQPVRWWDVDVEKSLATYNYDDPEGEFLRLMRDSVKLRLRSDVPVGTCLSGGLDSSTIVALATEQLNGKQMNSFSALYAAKGLDERRYVDIMVQYANTIRHEVTPSPDQYLSTLEKITWYQDIPTASPTVYSQYHVMRLAHGSVTVLLDGQGADELMAGYLSHVVFHLNTLRRQAPLQWVGEQLAFMVDVWPRFNASLNWREFGTRIMGYLTKGQHPDNILKPEYEVLAHQRQQEIPKRSLNSGDALNRHLYTALVRDSIPSLLHYEDRNSMAYSIEARVPFLDHRLVEFALGVPAHLKVRGAETKYLMRRALRGVLPDTIVNRKDKLGFPTPFGQWLRTSLRREIETYLNDKVFKSGWYDTKAIKNVWQSHLAGKRNADRLIHRLITAEQWYEQHTS